MLISTVTSFIPQLFHRGQHVRYLLLVGWKEGAAAEVYHLQRAVESLESGLYFVKIVDSMNNSVVRKVVKR